MIEMFVFICRVQSSFDCTGLSASKTTTIFCCFTQNKLFIFPIFQVNFNERPFDTVLILWNYELHISTIYWWGKMIWIHQGGIPFCNIKSYFSQFFMEFLWALNLKLMCTLGIYRKDKNQFWNNIMLFKTNLFMNRQQDI